MQPSLLDDVSVAAGGWPAPTGRCAPAAPTTSPTAAPAARPAGRIPPATPWLLLDDEDDEVFDDEDFDEDADDEDDDEDPDEEDDEEEETWQVSSTLTS